MKVQVGETRSARGPELRDGQEGTGQRDSGTGHEGLAGCGRGRKGGPRVVPW